MGLLSTLGLQRPASWSHEPAADRAPLASSGAKALPVWTAAKDEVGAQLGKLQAAFRKTGDPLAIAIADKGLNALTQRLQVGLQKALIGFDSAPAAQRSAAAASLRAAAAEMKSFLATNPVLPMLEANPCGVLVTIRSSLGTALEGVERATLK